MVLPWVFFSDDYASDSQSLIFYLFGLYLKYYIHIYMILNIWYYVSDVLSSRSGVLYLVPDLWYSISDTTSPIRYLRYYTSDNMPPILYLRYSYLRYSISGMSLMWYLRCSISDMLPSVVSEKLFSIPTSCYFTTREANEARWPHTCSRPCAFEEKNNRRKTHGKNVRPTQNTPRNPQQPGDRVQLETACEETRPTR